MVAGNSNATVHLTGTVLANPLQNSIYTERTSGTGIPTVTTSYSDYDPTTIVTYNSAAYVPGTGDVSSYVDPKFANTGAGDFHLLANSTLLNFDPHALGIFDSPTDLDGLPRPQAGPQDLGAFQHHPPTVSAAASPSPAHVGKAITFTATGTEIVPNDGLSYAWKFDDGASATGASVSHAFTTPGPHSATVTATDQLGFTAGAPAGVTVTSVAPTITALTQTHRSWRTGSKAATISRHRKRQQHRPRSASRSSTRHQLSGSPEGGCDPQ